MPSPTTTSRTRSRPGSAAPWLRPRSNPIAVASGGGNGSLIYGDTIGVSATNTSSILNVTFDVSAAGDAALGAAVSVNKIADTTDAHIADSAQVKATTAISLTAGNTSNINATAGSGQGSGRSARGRPRAITTSRTRSSPSSTSPT